MKTEYATIRIVPVDENDDEQEEAAMEYEYNIEEDIILSNILDPLDDDNTLYKIEITGNAMCIETDSKTTLKKLYNDIKTALPHLNFGIEYNYWIE